MTGLNVNVIPVGGAGSGGNPPIGIVNDGNNGAGNYGGNVNGGVNVQTGVNGGGDRVHVNVVNDQAFLDLDFFKSKFNELKNENRSSKINAEKSRHRSPQVKRSISFLMQIKHKLEDLAEISDQQKKLFYERSTVNGDKFTEISNLITESNSMIDDEILKNQMASKSSAGWKTVQLYEEDNLFVDDIDAEQKSKKFRAAERSANMLVKNSNKGKNFRGKGRGGVRGGYSGSGDMQSSGASGSGAGASRGGLNNFNKGGGSSGFQLGPCYKCGAMGHRIADCKDNK